MRAVRAQDDLVAPAPTVGMFITYSIKPRLRLLARADFLDVKVGDLEADLLDTRILIEWFFSRHVGFGVGMNTMEIQVRDTGSDPFAVDYRQKGLLGYFTLSF